MNKEAILLFQEVSKLLTSDNPNAIDYEKLSKRDSIAARYVCSKIPEFFSRGINMLDVYYALFVRTREIKPKEYSASVLKKLSKGDFSEFENLKKVYPYLLTLYGYINSNIRQIERVTNRYIWDEGHLLNNLMDNPKYQEINKQIINDDGFFSYHDRLYSLGEMDSLIEENKQDEETLKIAKRLLELYNLIYEKNLVFNESKKEELRDNLKIEKEYQEKRLKELDDLERQLIDINDELSKYNFITSIFKRKAKEELIKRKNRLLDKIKKVRENIDTIDNWCMEQENNLRFIEEYEDKYIRAMQEKTVPLLKEKLKKYFKEEEIDGLNMILDSLFTSERMMASSGLPIRVVRDTMGELNGKSYEQYMDNFNNAIVTICGISKSFLAFENSEKKDLFTLLKCIRKNLANVPTDTNHGEIEEEFRTDDIFDASQFMSKVAGAECIEEYMKNLSHDYDELMKEENLEEYIKKVGIIWYRFIGIHPYSDGNGRTGRYLINILLAHRNIIIPSLYNSDYEQTLFNHSMDKFVTDRSNVRDWDFKSVGEIFYKRIKEIGIDLSTQNRLHQEKENEQEYVDGSNKQM